MENTEVVNSNAIRPVVYQYTNFRDFLKNFFVFKKACNANYSYRVFTRIAGFQSHSYIAAVVSGRRNLPSKKALRVAETLGLSADETRFFMILVDWNQATTEQARSRHWENLVKLLPAGEVHILNEREKTLLQHRFSMAILEMVKLKNFKADPIWISKRLKGRASPEEAGIVFNLLAGVGLIRENQGKWEHTHRMIFSGGDIPSRLIRDYHRAMIPEGVRALATVDVREREVMGSSLPVLREDIPKLKEAIREFEQRISNIVCRNVDADEIYQLNMQFFPLTQNQGGE